MAKCQSCHLNETLSYIAPRVTEENKDHQDQRGTLVLQVRHHIFFYKTCYRDITNQEH